MIRDCVCRAKALQVLGTTLDKHNEKKWVADCGIHTNNSEHDWQHTMEEKGTCLRKQTHQEQEQFAIVVLDTEGLPLHAREMLGKNGKALYVLLVIGGPVGIAKCVDAVIREVVQPHADVPTIRIASPGGNLHTY